MESRGCVRFPFCIGGTRRRLGNLPSLIPFSFLHGQNPLPVPDRSLFLALGLIPVPLILSRMPWLPPHHLWSVPIAASIWMKSEGRVAQHMAAVNDPGRAAWTDVHLEHPALFPHPIDNLHAQPFYKMSMPHTQQFVQGPHQVLPGQWEEFHCRGMALQQSGSP